MKRMHDAECGAWVDDADLFGHDIPNSGALTVGRDACMLLCTQTSGCNAVTYKKYSNKCWLKTVPEGESHIDDWASDTYLLCEDQRLSGAVHPVRMLMLVPSTGG